MKIDFTDAAIADLKSIRNYTLDQWGPDQEQAYMDAMWSKFEELTSAPERFRNREDLFPECQIAAQGKHVILFRVNDGDILQIVRVLHSAMDYSRHVSKNL
jgi:toxin ParE1/3/4